MDNFKKHGTAALVVLSFLVLIFLLSGCGESSDSIDGILTGVDAAKEGTRDSTPMVLEPQSGDDVFRDTDGLVQMDISNSSEGYFLVSYSGEVDSVKIRVEHADSAEPYTHDLTPDLYGMYEVFTFSQGNGDYTVGVWEEMPDGQYVQLLEETIPVSLTDEYKPFLYPNQTVNFSASSQAVAEGSTLARSADTELDAVRNIYGFVVKNITYDDDKAHAVLDGTIAATYTPNADQTLSEKKGICYDYAALMATMLRSQKIPTKLVKGYADGVYHAWLYVYSTETGEVDKVIEFNGSDWTLMDPTFAATAGTGVDFVGSGTNYDEMFIY